MNKLNLKKLFFLAAFSLTLLCVQTNSVSAQTKDTENQPPFLWSVYLNSDKITKENPVRQMVTLSQACLEAEIMNIPDDGRIWKLQIWKEDSQGREMLSEETVPGSSAKLKGCFRGPKQPDRTNFYAKLVQDGGNGWLVYSAYIDWVK